MAHSALLGVAIALALDFNIQIGVFIVCFLIALVVGRVGEQSMLSGDSTLGVLSHSSLAIGLVLVSLMYWIRCGRAPFAVREHISGQLERNSDDLWRVAH